MPRSFNAGGRTSVPLIAATTSSKSPRRMNCRRCLKPERESPSAFVRIEWLLRRPQFDRHVLQVHADARPGMKPAAHRVDEDVGRREVGRGFGVARPPTFEPGQRSLLALRAGGFNPGVA